MRRGVASDTVEFSLGPHNARDGWEVARITYDASNPKHLAQVEAAITAMVKARGETVPAAIGLVEQGTALCAGGRP
jgi:hypothetical protein